MLKISIENNFKNKPEALKMALLDITEQLKNNVKLNVLIQPTRAVDTGLLFESISSDLSEINRLKTIVGSPLEYVPYVEYGTHTKEEKWKMAPRPIFRLAYLTMQKHIRPTLNKWMKVYK